MASVHRRSQAIAAEMRQLEADDRATEAELQRTLSQITRLLSDQPCEPEPEPEVEPDEDGPELARTLTQEVFTRLVEHPNLSEGERARVRAAARRDCARARGRMACCYITYQRSRARALRAAMLGGCANCGESVRSLLPSCAGVSGMNNDRSSLPS